MTIKSRGWEVADDRDKRDMCWNNPLKLKFITDECGMHWFLQDFIIDLIVYVRLSSGLRVSARIEEKRRAVDIWKKH